MSAIKAERGVQDLRESAVAHFNKACDLATRPSQLDCLAALLADLRVVAEIRRREIKEAEERT